jgi:hypothetical protein
VASEDVDVWISRASLIALVGAELALSSLVGCKADRCRSFAPALELQVAAPPSLGADARQLAVTLTRAAVSASRSATRSPTA